MSEPRLSLLESYRSVVTIPGMDRLAPAERARIWKESFIATDRPWRPILFAGVGLLLGWTFGDLTADPVAGLCSGTFLGTLVSAWRHVVLARRLASRRAMGSSPGN